ncbi:MAG: hypothetical protein VW450_02120 [Chloroflexota bacterium]
MSTQPTGDNKERNVSWFTPEIAGEVVLLLFVLILMIAFAHDAYGLISDRGYARAEGGVVLPILTIGFGLPFFILRARTVITRKKRLEKGMIMDLGFRVGEDPAGERRRAVNYVVSIAALFAGIWLIGFHIAIPVWVTLLLRRNANASWLSIAIICVIFLVFLFGVMDYIIDTPWDVPMLFNLVGLDYFPGEFPTRNF